MNARTPSEQRFVDMLLLYDLEHFAVSLGYMDTVSKSIADWEAVAVLNYAERLSRTAIDDEERNLCLILCALIWEQRRAEWLALSAFLVQVLSRIGLGPTTRMAECEP